MNKIIETWNNIPNYEGLYEVSTSGEVRSLDKIVKYKDGRNRFYKSKILKKCINDSGYLCVGFDGKSFKISQLVAMAFLNHIPCGMLTVVHHIDNDKTNNNLYNLQLTTQRLNSYTHHVGSSKYKGVSFSKEKNKWRSYIRIKGKTKHLGYFDNEVDASISYNSELKNI